MADSLIALVQQSAMPQIDGMYWLMLLSRVGHILGAIILVGGLFYLRFVIPPVSAAPGEVPADQLFGGRRASWAKWVGIATALLLITGFANYFRIKSTDPIPTSYHMIIGLKILAGMTLFLLAALLAGRTAVAETIREKWRMWLNICLVLGLVTVIFGGVLRTLHLPHRTDVGSPPQLLAPANAPGQ
jgi:hypothetical protein